MVCVLDDAGTHQTVEHVPSGLCPRFSSQAAEIFKCWLSIIKESEHHT